MGDHLLRRRLISKLLQRQVAQQVGVDKGTIYSWETNRSKPEVKYMPAIIRFLGYNPLPPPSPSGLGERLVHCRTALGIIQGELARRLEVDACTLARWERGERQPAGAFKVRVARFLDAADLTWAPAVIRTA